MRWLIRGFLSLWAAGAAIVGVSFLKAPRSEESPGEGRVKCGSLSTLQIGEARFIRHGTDPFLVVRASKDEVQAFSAICTHLRCVLKWEADARRFVCPCHAGAFDLNGNVLAGPPQRPLPQYAAEVRSGEIIVRIHG
ncbi:MAG TPA: Rieske (2Fe-2S) protein [Candidatus Saccharimonadales bacterium]|nr:Rieske (2Fe-2S) protein [Candidatus Saccharimonadales bacterium]